MSESPPSEKKGFPVDALVPIDGHVRALLFENARVDCPRGLFWRFKVQFQHFEYRGETVRPSLCVDWIRLPIRDWRQLVGTHISGAYGDEGVEASFYVWEHDYAAEFDLHVLERDGARFRVKIALTVEFSGMDESDRDPRLRVSTEAWVPFWGIVLHEQVVGENPSPEDIRRAVEPLAELSCYGAAEDGILPPKP